MGRVHAIYNKQKIPATLEEVWALFSDANNLLRITPPGLNLKATNEIYGNELYAGQVMTYKVRPLLGIPLNWMTEITHVHPLEYFVDEQRKGPYKLWHHQHHFKNIKGGVEMIDIVHYRLPFGFFGELVSSHIVRRQLQTIFRYRYQKIEEFFGKWKGGEMDLRFQ